MTNNALSRIQYIFYCNTYTAANYKFLPWGNFVYILDNINKTTKKTINKQVGDDVFRDDPTVLALEARIAAMAGNSSKT